MSEVSKYSDLSRKIANLSSQDREVLIELLKEEGIDVSREFIIPISRDSDGFDLSYAQERLWFYDQLESGSSLFNVPEALRFKGELDIRALHYCFNALVKRHEALRTTFKSHDGKAVQVIAPSLTLPLPIVDLVELPEEEREAEIHRLNAEVNLRPFDLSQGPLLRVVLLRLADRDHVLLFTIHHIVSDGWSSKVLIRESVELYDAFSNGREPSLPDLPLKYVDFAYWQRNWLRDEVLEEQLSYWRQQLGGELPVLQMPTDRPRPSIQTYRGAGQGFMLPLDFSNSLRRLSSRLGGTLFMTLIAAFQTLLHRYTSQDDIIVGTGIANRNRVEIENMIGFFANVLFLRVDFSGNPTFPELFNRVREVTLEAYAHQDLPFQMLVDKLGLERDMSRSQPVTQVMFALQNQPPASVKMEGVRVEQLPSVEDTAKYDLTLSMDDMGAELFGAFAYSTELFDAETISRMIGHFQTLLESIVENEQQHLTNLPLLSEEERRQVLVDFNNTRLEFAQGKSLVRLLEEQVERTPGALAVVDEDQQLNYTQLNNRANQLAHYLRKKGVGPGSIVALMEDRTAEMLISVIGVLKAGGAYLPIDKDIPKDRLRAVLDDSNTRILLTRDHLVKHIPFTTLMNLHTIDHGVMVTAPRPKIMDIDSLPFPDRSMIDFDKYSKYIGAGCVKKSISILSSRGCPFQCVYCHQIMSKKFVQRSAENLFQEVEYHYRKGYNTFVIVDDIFNLDRENSSAFFRMVLQNKLNIRILFPNGLRGDILTPDYIDLMAEAGVIEFGVALESASPRLQKLIRKNLDIDKLRKILNYTAKTHPQIILDIFTMSGFPSETEEEALMTLDFLKSIQWLHFPAFNTVKIYPGTAMAQWAIQSGASAEDIRRAADRAFHQLPDYLPFSHNFARELQRKFFNEYFLLPERLKAVIEVQKKVLTLDEIVDKYESYLPGGLKEYPEITGYIGDRSYYQADGFHFPQQEASISISPVPGTADRGAEADSNGKFRILLLDLSQHFSDEAEAIYDVVEPPLGLLYLLTYLDREMGDKVRGTILKSRIDFDNFQQLKTLVREIHPQLIGIRTLTFFRKFFHKTLSLLKQWGVDVPVITGGPYGSSDYRYILSDSYVDICVLSEGELTLKELVEKIIENGGQLPADDELAKIPGIAFLPRQLPGKNRLGQTREVLLLDKIAAEIGCQEARDPERVNTPGDPAYVLYTSGSTGMPKGVIMEHKAVNNLVNALHRNVYSRYPSPLNVTLIASYTFDPSVQQIFAALQAGHALYVVPDQVKRDRERLLEYYQNNRIDISDGTPSLIYILVYSAPGPEASLGVRHFIIGGEPFSVPLALQFYETFGRGSHITNIYGVAECTVDSTAYLIHPDALTRMHSIPIGKPLSNCRVYIRDGNLNLLPIGIPGDIYIAGEGVGRGYLNQPELTVERFCLRRPGGSFCKNRPLDREASTKNFLLEGTGKNYLQSCNHATMQLPFDHLPHYPIYRTGDIGRWLPDGNIEFLGRSDHQVKTRGFRIELGEIESLLRNHKDVNDCIVLAREKETAADDADRGSRQIQYCTRCFNSSPMPGISFDEAGVCSDCRDYYMYYDKINRYFKTEEDLKALFGNILRHSTTDCDCLLLYSGGKDSTYVLYRLVDMGLRVLTFTFDNGYISDTAFANIKRVCNELKVENITCSISNMDQVFYESLRSDSTVCIGCFRVLTFLSTRLAIEKNIPAVVTGLSRGQIFATKLQGFLQQRDFDIDRIETNLSLFRKMYHSRNDRTSELLGDDVLKDEAAFDSTAFIDFFRYSDVTKEEIINFLKSRDSFWEAPRDTGFCSSNCVINDVGIHVHLQEKGYHNYANPVSWEVRLGHITHETGRKELQNAVDESKINSILEQIGYSIAGTAAPGTQAKSLPGDKRLLAYVIPRSPGFDPEPGDHGADNQLSKAHLSDWEKVFNDTYNQGPGDEDPLMNIIGWNSSYTGQPIPAAEMREWVERTVERILSLQPGRVLEIGCGTGLVLFRVAPRCSQYIGTDFSKKALDYIRQQIENTRQQLPEVNLMQREADNFDGIEDRSVDTVILNSVVQYFPGVHYLVNTLEGAVRAVEPGGVIFLGDLRSLPLLEVCHTSIELHRVKSSTSKEQLLQRVKKRMTREKELLIDPRFFFALKQQIPRISHVEVLLKRGQYHNELTRFRYDVVLHIENQRCKIVNHQWKDWQQEELTLSHITQMLELQPEFLSITSVPNSRVITDVQAWEWLKSGEETENRYDLASARWDGNGKGIDPEMFWQLSSDFPYEVKIDWSLSSSDGSYNVLFQHNPGTSPPSKTVIPVFPNQTFKPLPLDSYVNNPLQSHANSKLVPALRSYLEHKLPGYMIPSDILLLDAFPLTHNGKVDLKRLPDPDGFRPDLDASYIAPRTEIEKIIAAVVKNALHLDKVGINDNFFDLGCDSLLMVRIHRKVQKSVSWDLSLVDMFQYPSINALAQHLSEKEEQAPRFDQTRERAQTRRQQMKRQRQNRENIKQKETKRSGDE